MADASDWRLQGQEKYLKGVELHWHVYRSSRDNAHWDHDHCEFCRAKFMVEEHPDVLHEGYSTLDDYRWICGGCFEEFKELFQWRVVQFR